MKSTASAWSRVVKPIVDALADSAHACESSGLPEARTLSYAAIVALTYLGPAALSPIISVINVTSLHAPAEIILQPHPIRSKLGQEAGIMRAFHDFLCRSMGP